jgi:hypothetical protein
MDIPVGLVHQMEALEGAECTNFRVNTSTVIHIAWYRENKRRDSTSNKAKERKGRGQRALLLLLISCFVAYSMGHDLRRHG